MPAFFSPKSFLHCLAQTRSRNEEVPIDDLLHHYEVQQFMEANMPCMDRFSVYIHGFWLEGCEWESDKQLLVESTKTRRFVQFPVIKLSTPELSELPGVEGKKGRGRNESTRSL